MSATGSSEGPWSGTWTVGAFTPNTLIIVDDNDGTDWSFAVLLDGSIANGGSLLIGDVFLSSPFQDGEIPDLLWLSIFFVSIAPISGVAL